jgi:hypothetical protein
MPEFETEKQLLQSKVLILVFFLGAVALSNNLMWLYGAGPRAVYIIQISLGISVIVACTMITAAFQQRMFSAPLLISSGWLGFVVGWILSVLELESRQRGTWIMENLGTSTASLLTYSVIAGVLFLVAFGGTKLLRRPSVSAVATWICFTLAFLIVEGLQWLDLLQKKG